MTRTMRWSVWSVIVAAVLSNGVQALTVVGDCNGNGTVSGNELVLGLSIALGHAPLSDCPPFSSGEGTVTIDALVTAITAALAEPAPQSVAFVVATDFATGGFATIALGDHQVTPTGPARQLGTDAVARTFNGLVYVVNRFGSDNIQVLDPRAAFATRWQCSTGAGSNPNDIALLNAGKGYVALLARAQVLVINPSPRADCSDFVRGSIDLTAYADADGIPDMNQLAVVGDRLYVSLERLANFVPAEAGAIVVIDTTTDQVVQLITLTGKNPFGMTKGLTVVADTMLVSEIGSFAVNDGGIERIDLTTNTAQGYVVTENDLGGDVTDFVWLSDQLAYAIISRTDFSTALVAFNPSTRTVTQTLTAGANLSDVEVNDRGELYVADRSVTQAGMRVFRSSDGVELTTAPLRTGLPPFDVVFVP